MTNQQIAKALMALRKDAAWTLRGSDLSGIEWIDAEQERPSDDEIIAKIEQMAVGAE